jgi:2-polyprenyl-3-methyl-5-hydroxy-6-metoxy-1,4-benzoquinol methylase
VTPSPALTQNSVQRTVPDERLWQLEERYRGSFPLEELSYGTVRDLADSADHLDGLASASSDMKDLQRCWMVKAILGNVAPDGTLVEIGAGEPLVADLLARLGHRVIVVDPYDGSGHGPRQFDEFRAAYPRVEFIRERFPPSRAIAEVDAVYSISVLEHVPVAAVGEVMEAAQRSLRPGGLSVHAIDHVLAGWSTEEHRERLDEIVRSAGAPVARLAQVLARLESDPEAYFVSPEAHERWRGDLAYDDYPMRKVASVSLATRSP